MRPLEQELTLHFQKDIFYEVFLVEYGSKKKECIFEFMLSTKLT